MMLLSLLFALLAMLALYGEFRYGISYSPFSIKQSSIYFLFQFLFCSIASLAFYLASREEKPFNESKEDS